MRSTGYDRSRVVRYLIWTFALAWSMQAAVAILYRRGSTAWWLVSAGMMFVPALLHGAINAATALPEIVCLADTGSARLLGPTPVGARRRAPVPDRRSRRTGSGQIGANHLTQRVRECLFCIIIKLKSRILRDSSLTCHKYEFIMVHIIHFVFRYHANKMNDQTIKGALS